MSNLYDLKSDSNHVKFFKWMWEVDPHIRFKTMCPYFWQYAGSIIILPLIIIWKGIIALTDPWNAYLQRKMDKDEPIKLEKILKDLEVASTDRDFYKIFKSKCYMKYQFYYRSEIDDTDTTGDRIFPQKVRDEIYERATRYMQESVQKTKLKKDKIQRQVDTFKYGKVGTFLSYVFGAAILSLIGWGIYAFAHSITWGEFVEFWLVVGGVALVITIVFGLIWSINKGVKRLSCDSPLANVVFWAPIGNGITTFFKLIWRGVVIFFDMIVNLYKKNCPVIHWE